MNAICKFLGAVCPYGELAGRIGLAAIFLLAGVGKIGGYAGTQGYMESQGVPGMLLPLVIAVEIIAPLGLIIGWKTRWCAFALAGFTVLTVLFFHFDFADRALMKNLAIAGGLLVLCHAGAGPFSLDKIRRKTN